MKFYLNGSESGDKTSAFFILAKGLKAPNFLFSGIENQITTSIFTKRFP